MPMVERWPEEIYQYIQDHAQLDDPLLREMEQRALRDNFPIIGPLAGPWLYFMARLNGAKRVFEMGSGYGYSTWYFASAVRDNGGGTVHAAVWDEKLSKEAGGWMERAGLLRYCDLQVGEAVLALQAARPGIDLVFLDIDKEDYLTALEVIETRLRPGGLLLADNVLWGGMVLHGDDRSAAGSAIRDFNDVLRDSPRWRYLINPLRDGLGVAQFAG
jgi:caffeoyl-CoA O-methyltransferase